MTQYVINLTRIYFIHKNDSLALRGAMDTHWDHGSSYKQG